MKVVSPTRILASLAAVAAFVACNPANAATIIGTEGSGGFTGTIPGTLVQVASDGENPFHPFNIAADVSDAISFDNQGHNWNVVAPSNWLQNPGTLTWYLPEDHAGGIDPSSEPVGFFVSADPWVASVLGEYDILDANGGVSDQITLFNNAQGANISFSSVPEPGALTLLGVGIPGLVCYGWRRRKRAHS